MITGITSETSASPGAPVPTAARQVERSQMVMEQLLPRGIRDPGVLQAMGAVPRHCFVPQAYQEHAYQDYPLSIGLGQTISQPYVVAAMTELLQRQPDPVVLEIGTGSGYQAAVLARLVHQVYSIEIVPALAMRAAALLQALGYQNVKVICGDGFGGLPEQAPFDGIIVTAAPKTIPAPLLQQLKIGGRLVIPVGELFQELKVVERTEHDLVTRTAFDVLFVPMTGEAQAQRPTPTAPPPTVKGCAPTGR